METSAGPLIPMVPAVASLAPRRADSSGSTKRVLIDVAEELFAEQGYSATSMDQIVAGARVTKGALYHHFSGKQALFESVFERIEIEARTAIEAGLTGRRDPWDRARTGLRTFLDVVQQPAYRQIVIQDGPSVLGYERFREHEERSTFATLVEIVGDVLTSGEWEIEDQMLGTFTRIFFGAMSAAGESVANSEDPTTAARRVEAAINFLIDGLQALADAGVPIPDPIDPGGDTDPV